MDVVQGDACDFECAGLPPAGTVDVVTFSYALTMIPDWIKAIKNAYRLLKPVCSMNTPNTFQIYLINCWLLQGGHIAVCDFTVAESQQWLGMAHFWNWLFAHDHVHLRATHIPVRALMNYLYTAISNTNINCLLGLIVLFRRYSLLLNK